MGSSISKDDIPRSGPEVGRSSGKPPEVREDPWKRIIIQKLEVVEKYYQKHGSSAVSPTKSSPSKEDYLVVAHQLGDVTVMASMLKEGIPANKKLTWKLVLTALPPKGPLKPIVNYLARGQPYGVVHAALQIGKYLIDWNDSGLVRPRELRGQKHYAALDLTLTGNEIPNCDDALFTSIAFVIVDWNRSEKKYDTKTRNCQHFVDELLQKGLGITPKWPFAIAKYLDGIREDCDNGLPHYINESGKRIFFQSHQELDQYVHDHRELTKDQKDLLKAFDRGYMIRWESSDFKDDSAAPLHANEAHVCHIFGPLTKM